MSPKTFVAMNAYELEPTQDYLSHCSRIPTAWCSAKSDYPAEANVAQLFEEQVNHSPDALALIWQESRLTYQQINEQANQLAHHLRGLGVGLETPVGIFLQRSPALFVSLLAVCKAGGSYLPLDPAYPPGRIQFMLQDARAAMTITDSSLAPQLPTGSGPLLLLDWAAFDIAEQPRYNLRHRACGEHRAYVMYTSGSTGQPKGIEIAHKGITRLVINTNYVQLEATDRVAQIASPSFDASTFEIWGAFLNGATLVGVAKDIALSPRAFAAQIVEDDLTAMFLTAALFNLVARESPAAFRSLRHLIVGGEALTPRWVRRVLRHGAPQRLVNGYGPTESTTFASYHLIEKVPLHASSIPIGRPLANTQLYILDAALQPTAIGVVGELYIGGDGLARGYLNRPELTRERFIQNPFGLPGERLYKTGDLARWLPEGVIDYVGRVDQQVKIRGYRIELEEIKTVLLRHPSVQDVAVVVREDTADDKRIVAYVIPRQRGLIDDKRRIRIACAGLKNLALEKLPQYMIPSAFVFLEALPISANGKVNHAALPDPRLSAHTADGHGFLPATPTEVTIAAIWCKLLGARKVFTGDDFMEQGGNSYLAAQLILQVQSAFNLEFPIHLFFEQPCIAHLAKKVDLLRRLAPGCTAAPSKFGLRVEAALDRSIQPAARMAANPLVPRRIFLTGATGFLGAHLLRKCLADKAAEVHCLVRAKNFAEGQDRIRRALRRYALWQPELEPRIFPACGDLGQPCLGLDKDEFDELAENIEVIYHSGARINYVEPYSAHRRPNVLGTHEVLRLASHRVNKPVHYVSSISVFGAAAFFAGVTDLHEGSKIDDCDRYLSQDLGYTQSKWVCEKLVAAARKRGLVVSIYRPGFILGHSKSGHCNLDDFMARVLIGCIAMGRFPRLGMQKKEFVPVDYASDAIFHLSRQAACLGGTFHIVPPSAEQSVTVDEFFRLVAENGYPMTGVPYATWKGLAQEFVKEDRGRILMPLIPMLTERVHKGSLTRWELYQPQMNFHCENTTQGLYGSAVRYPAMDHELIKTYLSYLLRAGHLPH